MLLFLNNNYCWCTSTASLASRLRRMPTFFIFLRLAYVERVPRQEGFLLLWLVCDSLLLTGCVLQRLYPPYYQSVCLLFEFTTVIYSVNAARMQSVQYIHRFFLGNRIWCERRACLFLYIFLLFACLFKVAAFTLVIYSVNATWVQSVLSAFSLDSFLSHCCLFRLHSYFTVQTKLWRKAF